MLFWCAAAYIAYNFIFIVATAVLLLSFIFNIFLYVSLCSEIRTNDTSLSNVIWTLEEKEEREWERERAKQRGHQHPDNMEQ